MAIADTSVRLYQSTMSGATHISGTAGAFIAMLDSCRAGIGTVTLTSPKVVVASDVATCTCSTGHGFVMMGLTGPVITIAGASPSSLNGDWRIDSVPGSNTFTFLTTGIPDQTATGTITANIAGMPLTKVYSGTNKAVYQFNIGSQRYLRVDDTNAQVTQLVMYEAMSDVNTGTGLAPLYTAMYFGKSNVADGSAREWNIFSDPWCMYCFGDPYFNQHLFFSSMVFGDPITFVPGDIYHCILGASTSNSVGVSNMEFLNTADGMWMAREYTQLGAAIQAYRTSHPVCGGQIGGAGVAYPNAATGELIIAPVDLWNADRTSLRGHLPGVYSPLHPYTQLIHGVCIEGTASLPGRTLFLQIYETGQAGFCAIDITGPWR